VIPPAESTWSICAAEPFVLYGYFVSLNRIRNPGLTLWTAWHCAVDFALVDPFVECAGEFLLHNCVQTLLSRVTWGICGRRYVIRILLVILSSQGRSRYTFPPHSHSLPSGHSLRVQEALFVYAAGVYGQCTGLHGTAESMNPAF